MTVSASGGDGDEEGEYATVTFGKNPKGLVHTVTVTVSDGVGSPTKYAYFDRVIEHFNEVELPVPNDDENAPQLFFARSLPQAGSIAAETADNKQNFVNIKAYVFDETGIASVTINSKTVPIVQKDDVRFWTALLEFSENGSYTITTIDDYGNLSNYQLNVDWFSNDASQEDMPEVPQVDTTVTCFDQTYTDSYTDTTGEPLGHDFVAGDVVPPTCITGGYTVYTSLTSSTTTATSILPVTVGRITPSATF